MIVTNFIINFQLFYIRKITLSNFYDYLPIDLILLKPMRDFSETQHTIMLDTISFNIIPIYCPLFSFYAGIYNQYYNVYITCSCFAWNQIINSIFDNLKFNKYPLILIEFIYIFAIDRKMITSNSIMTEHFTMAAYLSTINNQQKWKTINGANIHNNCDIKIQWF